MKLLNRLGLYTKKDLKQAFENGTRSQDHIVYFVNEKEFKMIPHRRKGKLTKMK